MTDRSVIVNVRKTSKSHIAVTAGLPPRRHCAAQEPGRFPVGFERPLTAGRRAISSMLYSAQGSIGACVMDVITLVAFIASMYLAGRLAERRGRSFKSWAWIAAIIGPLALPAVFLFPNLHKNGDQA
jgi:hypothetical protein